MRRCWTTVGRGSGRGQQASESPSGSRLRKRQQMLLYGGAERGADVRVANCQRAGWGSERRRRRGREGGGRPEAGGGMPV
jgi:hypothetical protein